jgi:ATP-dependent RNA helicase DeaD
VVLDEADEMLDMGFAEDLEAILSSACGACTDRALLRHVAAAHPDHRQKHLKDPLSIAIARERTQAGEVPRVRQVAYVVQRAHKPAALGRVLDMESPTSAIVFCRTRWRSTS